MRWAWLDRELARSRAEVLARVKTREAQLWFSRYQSMSKDLSVAKAERDTARDDLGVAIAEKDALSLALAAERKAHWDEGKDWQEERARFERALTQAVVPAPTAHAKPDDRTALYRLEADNARLRDANNTLERLLHEAQERLAKYEGATP